jgi:hypothetical protein
MAHHLAFVQRFRTFFARSLLGILLLTLPLSAYTQNEGRWYTVEIMIFKRLGGEAYTRELWRKDIKLRYPSRTQYLQPVDAENFSQLSEENYQLSNHRVALQRTEDYRILYHRAWEQQMFGKSDSPAIVISGGEMIGPYTELSGHIKIYIGRYLHLSSDLWLITDKKPSVNVITGYDTLASENWPVIPHTPEDRDLVQSNAENTAKIPIATLDAAGNVGVESQVRYPLATMRSTRRMRSKELHYLDHPLMGILILFTPLDKDTK